MKKSNILIQTVSVCLVLTVCLSGCGKNDELLSELQTTGGITTEIVISSEATVEGNKPGSTSVRYDIDLGSNGKKITVDVVAVDTSQEFGSVFDTQITDRTDEGMTKLAASIFDNGEFEIIKPPFSGTREEADDFKNRLEEELAEYAKNYPDVNVEEETMSQLCAYRGLMAEIVHAPKVYGDNVTEEGQFYYDDASYKSGKIGMARGNIDGEQWLLTDSYNESGNVGNPPTCYLERMFIIDEESREIGIVESGMDDTVNELDHDEALEKAVNMLAGLGFGEYVEDNCYELIVFNHDMMEEGKAIPAMGYCFNLVPEVKDAKGEYSDNTVLTVCENGEQKYSTVQKYARVYVTTDGVVSIEFGDNGLVGEEIESGVEFITFEEADDIFKNEISQYVSKSMTIDRIELRYVTVNYAEGAAFVPAYVYYMANDYSVGYSGKLAIAAVNALNGEFIFFDSPVLYNR